MKVFPWQQTQWRLLLTAIEQNRLPHGLLLTGPAGIGLSYFAQCLAAALLCDSYDEQGAVVSENKSWHLYTSGNHPDLLLIEPEEEGKQIKVDQVRALIDFVQLKSQYGRYKIAIIDPAESMNRSAANSLLKTLEEPPPESLIILNSHNPANLPVTIRSRCQTISFECSLDEVTRSWLANQIDSEQDIEQLLRLAGSPFAALDLLEEERLKTRRLLLDDLAALRQHDIDPTQVAERWKTMGEREVVRWLQRLFLDMLRLRTTDHPPNLQSIDLTKNLQQLLKGLNLMQLLSCCELLARLYGRINSTISYNTQGLFEEFIIFWQQLNTATGGQHK